MSSLPDTQVAPQLRMRTEVRGRRTSLLHFFVTISDQAGLVQTAGGYAIHISTRSGTDPMEKAARTVRVGWRRCVVRLRGDRLLDSNPKL